MNAEQILKDNFGYSSFRKGQKEIVDNILNNRDVLAVMPTGAGKSICYQVPALMKSGITIVISPLISLMKDQVNSLLQLGIRAAFINGSLNFAQINKVSELIRKNTYKIIYVAPERLLLDSFLSAVMNSNVSIVAVDEAHCVSQWGQDFRPSYMKIPEFISKLKSNPVVGAFTATATKVVKDDIVRILGLKSPFLVTTGFDRPNLYFDVRTPDSKKKELLKILSTQSNKSGIIYCSTRKNVEMVAEFLNQKGYGAVKYHAGLNKEERTQNQDDFVFDRTKIIVATNAFGMGIDKSNVSFVIHYNMPMSLEAYYQEAGRAGRDGLKADCILLFSEGDIRMNEFLISHSKPSDDIDDETFEKLKEKDRQRLKTISQYCKTTDCLRWYILKYFGETSQTYCGNCSVCNAGYDIVNVTKPIKIILSCIARTRQKFGLTMVCDIVRGANNLKIKQYNLNTQSTFGMLKKHSQSEIRDIINFLLVNGYLSKSDDEYPILIFTNKTKDILFSNEEIKIKIVKKISSESHSVNENDIDFELYEKLRKLRTDFAKKASVPAYVVFSDATLRNICSSLPSNMQELLGVSGIGKQKAERYGKDFLEVIEQYKTQNNL